MASKPNRKRPQQKNKGQFALSAPQEQILIMVARYGYVTTHHIARRHFNGNSKSSQMAKYIKELDDAGFITRFRQPPPTAEARNMPMVAALAKSGAEYAAAALEVEVDDLHVRQAAKQPQAAYFEHLMAINDVRVLFELACAQHGYPMRWLTERTIRSKQLHVPVTVSTENGGTEQAANIPDGFFGIQTPRGYYSFFLEVDRGTETHKILHNKARVYLAYEQSSHYAQYYSAGDAGGATASLFALLVTSSSRRCHNIVASLGKAFPDQPFLCTTYSRLTAENILTEPIWHAPQFETPQPLIIP